MGYTAGYFGKGYRGTPIQFPDESPASKRRRIDTFADTATALGLPEVGGLLHEINDFATGDQYVPLSVTHPGHLAHPGIRDSSARQSSKTSSKRSSKGMRSRHRRFRKGRKSERARIFSQVLRMCDTKQIDFNLHEFSLAPGDLTSPTLLLKAPYQAVAQGSAPMNYNQSKVFLRGIKISATAMAIDPTNAILRLVFFKTRDQFDTTVNGTVLTNVGVSYQSTTTGVTNPTQTVPFSNVTFFDETANPYVGTSIVTPFNHDAVQILKEWRWNFNTSGQEATHPLRVIKRWLPINQFWRINEVEETTDLPATSVRDGNYGYFWQVFGGEDETSNTALVQIKEETRAFWKEP